MGIVYEAYDRDRRELVALKMLRSVTARGVAQLKREFRSLHDLYHPNLVGMGELFDRKAGAFFTMELVRGVDFWCHVCDVAPHEREAARSPTPTEMATTMRVATDFHRRLGSAAQDALPRRRSRSRPRARDEHRLRAAVAQLVEALAALHATGKVHRDVKPSNILVTADDRVVLLDFGLVIDIDRRVPTTDAPVVGTGSYMAPEQALAGYVTASADWYSLGVLLYEALTGELPHTGRTLYEMVVHKQHVRPAAPRSIVPEVPADLDALCMALLRVEPDERPDAPDILERLGATGRPSFAAIRERSARLRCLRNGVW